MESLRLPKPSEVLLEMANRADETSADKLREAVRFYLASEADNFSLQSIEHAAEFCEQNAGSGFNWLGQAASYLTSCYSVLSVCYGLDLIPSQN